MFPGTWTLPASCPPARGEDTLHADPVGTVKYDGGKKLLVRNCADAMPLRGSELDPVLRDLEALFIVKDHCPLYVVPGGADLTHAHECSMPSHSMRQCSHRPPWVCPTYAPEDGGTWRELLKPEGRTSLEGLEACSPPLPVPGIVRRAGFAK